MTKYRNLTLNQITSVIDHSILRPEFTTRDVVAGAEVAKKYQTASYCIRPMDVALAADLLRGSGVAVCTVIGFPHGSSTTASKAFEAKDAIANGATELDMVLNISALISGDLQFVEQDIKAVVAEGVPVKVILETAYLSDDQIVAGCRAAEAAGADYVKTSTGFAPAGASLEHVRLMKQTVGDRLRVKSSGGIKTLDQLVDFIEAGVSRSGCSATEAVVAEFMAKAT